MAIYKYQQEMLKEIQKASQKIEEKTNERYKILIGNADVTKVTYGAFKTTEHQFSGELYLLINYSSRFEINEAIILGFESKMTFSDIDFFNWIKIDKNIFLKLNQLIDEISKDNFEREQFYNELNAQLKAYNQAMEVIL